MTLLTKKSIVACGVSIAAAALVFCAVGHFRGNGAAAEQQWARQYERTCLQLTSAQRDKLDHLNQLMREKTAPLRKEARRARLDLIDLLSQPNPDRGALDRKLDDISGLDASMQREVVEHLLRTKQALSQEQQERLFRTMCEGLCAGESEHHRDHDGCRKKG
jgi:Spy/CpxP family protein refolding chaperone